MKMSTSPVSQRALSGSFWMGGIRWLDRIAAIVSAMVLARLLKPRDFGLVALAMTAISFLNSLTALGLEAAIVQRPDCDRHDYDVAWTYGRVLRGLFLFAVIYLAAPWLAQFYGELQLTAILRVLAVSELFIGTTNIGVVAFLKELNFRKQFYLQASGGLARLVVVIPLAFLWRNVWALVAGTLAGEAVRLLMSYYLRPFRPRFNFDLKRARSLFAFGGWLFGVQFVKTARGIIDRAILGRLLGATELGYYQIGLRFGQEMPSEIKTVVSKVMFPVYSLMQHDKQRMANSFRQVLSIVLFLGLPICVGLALTADYFVFLVLGAKWESAIPVMQILAVAGSLQILIETGYPLYRGAGIPKLELVVTGVHLIFTIVFIVPLTMHLGPIGTAYALLASSAATVPLWWAFSQRISGLSIRDLFFTILPPMITTLLMTSGVLLVRIATKGVISWSAFAGSVFAGVGVFGMCVWVAWRALRMDSLERLFALLHPYWCHFAFFLSHHALERRALDRVQSRIDSEQAYHTPLRVLLVSWDFPPDYSGAGKLAIEAAQRLDASGETRTIALTKNTHGTASPEELIGSVRVIRLSMADRGIFSSQWIRSLYLYARLVLEIWRKRTLVDIIHTVTINRFSVIAIIVGKLLGLPVIAESTLAGDIYPVRPLDSAIRKAKFRLWWFLIKQADKIVCRSPAIADECARAGIPLDKVQVLPYSVDTEKFRPANEGEKTHLRRRLGIPTDAKVFLFVGGICARKGVDLIVRAFHRVVQTVKDAMLLLVGPTDKYPQDFIRELDEYIARYGLQERIRMTRQAVSNVDEYMRASDVFVFASQREGFGAVVIEAMASGLPVVTTYLPGISEIQVEHERTGLIVYERSVEALAQALLKVLTANQADLAAMGSAARQKAVDEYGTSKHDAEFIRLYRTVLSMHVTRTTL